MPVAGSGATWVMIPLLADGEEAALAPRNGSNEGRERGERRMKKRSLVPGMVALAAVLLSLEARACPACAAAARAQVRAGILDEALPERLFVAALPFFVLA